MNNPGRLLCVLTVACSLLFVSCNRKTVYHHYSHAPIAGWEKNDTLKFFVSPLQSGGRYHEDIELRINGFYPFMSLSLVVEQCVMPLNYVRKETLNYSLVQRNGVVKGKGVSTYQYSFHLTTLDLQAGDSIAVFVRHNMKREILTGIADVGFKLTKE